MLNQKQEARARCHIATAIGELTNEDCTETEDIFAIAARYAIDALGRIDTDHARQTLRGLAARAEKAAECGTVTERELFFGKAGR